MARKLRMEYEGALYHVINRGASRKDIFATPAMARAFETTLAEACELHHWKLHAFVVMRNHFHLALETPEPNLVAGMHWLQSTFATRFNRLRSERGPLFQGRYRALLVEDWIAMVRVVNYLHLNPVRAGLVSAGQVASFRWSSLAHFLKPVRAPWLAARDWLAQLGLEDTRQGWSNYLRILAALASDRGAQKLQGFDELSHGWATGTAGWRRAVAADHAQLALSAGLVANELKKLKQAQWTDARDKVLRSARKTSDQVRRDAKGADWKITAAIKLRAAGAPHRWIAEKLAMGNANSVRSYVSRRTALRNQMLSA
ncbi:MAG: transposase [Opitutus sp.]